MYSPFPYHVNIRKYNQKLRTIMKNLKLTAEQAMKALAIPASDKEKYLVKL